MSPLVASFLTTAALPAAAATVLIFFTGGLKEPLKARLQAVILAGAFAVGNYLLIGRLNLPPKDVGESLIWTGFGLSLFVALFPGAKEAPYLVRALFVALLGYLVLYHLGDSLKAEIHLRNMLAFFCLGLGLWSIFEKNVRTLGLVSMIGLPLMTATGLSFILLFSASATLSQTASILCSLFGGLLALALIAPGRLSRAATVPFLSVFLVLMMAAGHFYLGINPWKMVFLCIPFLTIWIREWLTFIPRSPVVEFLILAALSAGPLAYFLYDSFVTAGPLY